MAKKKTANSKTKSSFAFYIRKFLLSIFFVSEDIPYSANEFAEKAQGRIIFIFLSLFWLILIGIIVVSVLFFTEKNTLFSVSARAELIEVMPFEDVAYPIWRVEKAKIAFDCGNDYKEMSGLVQVSGSSSIEFTRLSTGTLEINLDSIDEPTTGSITNDNGQVTEFTDCATLILNPSKESAVTLPIDGIVRVGGSIKEEVSVFPIMYSGQVQIADKAALSQNYYLAEIFDLKMGEQFSILKPSTQSSGFIYANEEKGLYINFSGKGESGQIYRYKAEPIQIENNFWAKLYNDETLVFLWLLVVTIYTFIKVAIRYNIE
ncbi:hypothetical protein Q4574_12940 [Aliiglaciecola sp. 3_MG-2023]|uniref:hypothetical protein n=1 Tax=Aliiglaciecola sp. 3_MG-2023 TaxID=3062644 RepID=UPI0026E1C65C|nr:hypothetical protein [Aliiglaciecola sp. 3_MG-2023]MDO6694192.1 hypothetical protein [Aliiglaciecola sp. 3_MG-2023]